MRIRPQSYQVLITPLVARNTYGDVVDVTQDVDITDAVKEKGINTILREVDNGDYDIGVFVYNSINISCVNYNGQFSDPQDSRSMFKYLRDRAKVTINFFDGVSNTPAISFKGIVDDRVTVLDIAKNEVQMTILSEDSILNRVLYNGGTVPNGTLISNAIYMILNRPDVTNILNLSIANIFVANDYVIDDTSSFEQLTLKDILDQLLVASNSILMVDKSSNIIVRNRNHNSTTVFNLYGEGDILGRQNVISISDYNTGLHRTFNTFVFGNIFATNKQYANYYGDFQKSVTFDWITNAITKDSIVRDLVDHWKTPKIELIVSCKTSEVRDLGFFDLISLNYYYKVRPLGAEKLPMYGSAKYGQTKYPVISGSIKIPTNMAFKIIGIEEDPNTFETKLKLRQVGTDVHDGFFSTMVPNHLPARYGFSIYGVNEYTYQGF